MELFTQILGMTLIVLGLLAVAGGIVGLLYIHVWPGLKEEADPVEHSTPGVAANEPSGGAQL